MSQSFGVLPMRRSRTHPPTRYASKPAFLSMLCTSRTTCGMSNCIVRIVVHSLFFDDARRIMHRSRSRGETDITAVFGTAIGGSNPSGSKREAFASEHATCTGGGGGGGGGGGWGGQGGGREGGHPRA